MAGRPRRKAREAALRAGGGHEPTPSRPPSVTARIGPLEAFREGLALFRRAGMPWPQAQEPATEAALSVVPTEAERREWATALQGTSRAWQAAYERRPSGFSL